MAHHRHGVAVKCELPISGQTRIYTGRCTYSDVVSVVTSTPQKLFQANSVQKRRSLGKRSRNIKLQADNLKDSVFVSPLCAGQRYTVGIGEADFRKIQQRALHKEYQTFFGRLTVIIDYCTSPDTH